MSPLFKIFQPSQYVSIEKYLQLEAENRDLKQCLIKQGEYLLEINQGDQDFINKLLDDLSKMANDLAGLNARIARLVLQNEALQKENTGLKLREVEGCEVCL